VPRVVGVPLSSLVVEFSFSPGGSAPAETDQRYGATPPPKKQPASSGWPTPPSGVEPAEIGGSSS
jgi:hypothetical protein